MYSKMVLDIISGYAAFISGFDDQERNLMFVKTYFQVLKLKEVLNPNF